MLRANLTATPLVNDETWPVRRTGWGLRSAYWVGRLWRGDRSPWRDRAWLCADRTGNSQRDHDDNDHKDPKPDRAANVLHDLGSSL